MIDIDRSKIPNHCPRLAIESDLRKSKPCSMRILYVTRLMAQNLDRVFQALSDETRREILVMLLEDDMAVTDVADPFEISLAAISKHLHILAEAGLIEQERRGRVKWCKLQPEAMRDAILWIQGFGQFQAIDYDAFEAFLEAQNVHKNSV